MQDVDPVNVPGAEVSVDELDDVALLALARDGHQEAYAALFIRYSYAAQRLARHLGQKEDSEDVVAESFAQVLDLVRRGKGPEHAFRAYLFTTVRHECGRRAKARRRVMPTDDVEQIDQPVEFGAGQLDGFERSAIRAAYESLPQRWRTVLWHLDVEGRKPHELAPLMDLSSNSISALVYRARSGLREAYLQQHVKRDGTSDSRSCRDVRSKLSAFVRRTASARDQEKVHAHLESCSPCMAIYLDLQEVNRDVGAIIAPAALAASVAGGVVVVAATGGAAAAVTHAVVLGKGILAALAPPAAAAALTTATIVGATGTRLAEPTRTPLYAVAGAETQAPARDAAPRTSRSSAAPATPSPTAEVVQDHVSAARQPAVAEPDRPSTERGTTLPPRRPSRPSASPSVPAPPVAVDRGGSGGLLDLTLGGVRILVAASGGGQQAPSPSPTPSPTPTPTPTPEQPVASPSATPPAAG